MRYRRAHQDGSISPKKTQAEVVAHLYRIFIPHLCTLQFGIVSLSFGDQLVL